MEKKAKVKLCKCGAGIPPFSPNDVCYDCLNGETKETNLGKLKEITQKTKEKTVAKLKKKRKKTKRKTKRKKPSD